MSNPTLFYLFILSIITSIASDYKQMKSAYKGLLIKKGFSFNLTMFNFNFFPIKGLSVKPLQFILMESGQLVIVFNLESVLVRNECVPDHFHP